MTSPILAGTGVASEDAEAVDLMELAARRALAAAGAHDLSIDVVLTPKGTWGYGDPGREVARRLGSSRATSVLAELGISQQGLINEGLTMIADGRASVVAELDGDPTVGIELSAMHYLRLTGGRHDAGIDPADGVTFTGDRELGGRLVANMSFTI